MPEALTVLLRTERSSLKHRVAFASSQIARPQQPLRLLWPKSAGHRAPRRPRCHGSLCLGLLS